MTVTRLPEAAIPSPPEAVSLDGDRVSINLLEIDDPALAELLRANPPERWEAVVVRAVGTGARGLLSMGLAIDVAEIDERMTRTVTGVLTDIEECTNGLLTAGRQAITDELDPDRRSSTMAKALDEFAAKRDDLLGRLDPDRVDSHTARLMANLNDVLGPGGLLERRFSEMLDPGKADSVLTDIHRELQAGFQGLRDLLMESKGRHSEADRGTAKGFDYEDEVEDMLRTASRSLGAIVERTSTTGGELGPDVFVGDFVVALPAGARIAVEAKNTRTLNLTGPGGILAELDRASANRDATVSICVSAQPSFPAEVGPFGVYGNRILVVDDGDGLMLTAALRMAAQMAAAAAADGDTIDTAALNERLEALRRLSKRFSTTKKSLSDVTKSIDSVRDGLDAMRSELLELVGDIERSLSNEGNGG